MRKINQRPVNYRPAFDGHTAIGSRKAGSHFENMAKRYNFPIKKFSRDADSGFSLAELLTTIAIIGILSGVALPNFLRQLQRIEQSDVAATVAQIQSTIVAYTDEYGVEPSSWNDLSEISAVMTDTGPAGTAQGSMNTPITLINGKYTLRRLLGEAGKTFTLIADSVNQNGAEFNVMACLDLNTGASDLRLGNQSGINGAVTTADLRC